MRLAPSIFVAALAALAIGSCRDAVEPFQPTDREPPANPSLVRLTYSGADDRTPVWSANGDSIYYTAFGWTENDAPATLLAVAADGNGHATELLRNAQVGIHMFSWVGAPALAPNGTELAFVRLRLGNDRPCTGTRVCPRMEGLSMVRLTNAELHVRPLASNAGMDDDVQLPLEFEGLYSAPDPTVPGGAVTVSEYHPFQLAFEVENRAIFRPSWHPAGTALVVSDGLRLLRWSADQDDAVEIPGTTDGVSPAWSPDGEWIAYTRYTRAGVDAFRCDYVAEGAVQCVEQRIVHQTGSTNIVLTRPDGSEERVLGPGADPAWAPDGSAVYAAAVDGVPRIVRMPLDGGPAVPVPNSNGGIEPAVSPDGSRLAFARGADIWVVELE